MSVPQAQDGHQTAQSKGNLIALCGNVKLAAALGCPGFTVSFMGKTALAKIAEHDNILIVKA
jgi:hypothetical protein